MKKLRTALLLLLLAAGTAGKSQDKQPMPGQSDAPKLVAVINRAAWCAVCKENGPRVSANLMKYMQKGLTVLMNDLTDSKTSAASKADLQNADLYNAVAKTKETGVISFVNPVNHRLLKKLSLTVSDAEMKQTVETLLK